MSVLASRVAGRQARQCRPVDSLLQRLRLPANARGFTRIRLDLRAGRRPPAREVDQPLGIVSRQQHGPDRHDPNRHGDEPFVIERSRGEIALQHVVP